MSRLIDIKENKEIWIIENSPTADKRIYDRKQGIGLLLSKMAMK